MAVPPCPAMDSLVHHFLAHDGSWQLWCVDTNYKNPMVLSPVLHLLGEKGGMAELDSELFRTYFLDEPFEDAQIGEGGWELEKIVMDLVFQRGEEVSEPLESLCC